MPPFSPAQILHEDKHLLIINKACSQLTQGDKTGDSSLLDDIKAFIKIRDQKPGNVFCAPVHRLDRPSSGALIFAKTSKALSRMSNMFREGQVEKHYWVFVNAPPPQEQGTLKHYLMKDSSRNKSRAFNTPGRGRKEARLRYTVKYKTIGYFLLEIELLTGRHHQIRAQLADIGLHIRGDLKYGAKRSNPNGGISLHARNIAFIHPVSGAKINITASPLDVQDDTLWKQLPPSAPEPSSAPAPPPAPEPGQ